MIQNIRIPLSPQSPQNQANLFCTLGLLYFFSSYLVHFGVIVFFDGQRFGVGVVFVEFFDAVFFLCVKNKVLLFSEIIKKREKS